MSDHLCVLCLKWKDTSEISNNYVNAQDTMCKQCEEESK